MAYQRTATVLGPDELDRELRALGIRGAKKKKEVTLGAAKIIREAAVENAPQKTGNLKREIITDVLFEDENSIAVGVGPRQQGWAFYGLFLEFGADPHWIPRERGNIVLRIGRRLIGATVRHPGLPERPWLRPAFDNNIDEALAEAARVAREEIVEE